MRFKVSNDIKGKLVRSFAHPEWGVGIVKDLINQSPARDILSNDVRRLIVVFPGHGEMSMRPMDLMWLIFILDGRPVP